MLNPFSRTELLGRDAMERLAASRVADIYKTRVDPPARVMRRELKSGTSGNERPSIPRGSLFALLRTWPSAVGRTVSVLPAPNATAPTAGIFQAAQPLSPP